MPPSICTQRSFDRAGDAMVATRANAESSSRVVFIVPPWGTYPARETGAGGRFECGRIPSSGDEYRVSDRPSTLPPEPDLVLPETPAVDALLGTEAVRHGARVTHTGAVGGVGAGAAIDAEIAEVRRALHIEDARLEVAPACEDDARTRAAVPVDRAGHV